MPRQDSFVQDIWNESIIPTLQEYITIPNQSPAFDPEWERHGHMDRAMKLLSDWCHQQAIDRMALEIVRLPGRTPVLLLEIPGSSDETVLLYGHMDKQPEMTGWDSDLGPWKPVLKGDKLYGRGAADDGYAIFASLTAIKSLQIQQIPHARCVILIEASEESGSRDLPDYIDVLQDRLGSPSLVICLDSGCGNYDQLWATTSLRGLVGGTLSIDMLTQGIHSGNGGGIVPSCFLVLRQLLSRIEDERSGEIKLPALYADIPAERVAQASKAADILGTKVYQSYPFQQGAQPLSSSLTDLVLNRSWRPALAVTGVDGLPPIARAGNVLLPSLSFKLSMRLPPTCDAKTAAEALKTALEKEPPFGARVIFTPRDVNTGWNAPKEESWLSHALQYASKNYFGAEAAYFGEGGSIPFMGMLGAKFPKAQFVITGVLGPGSNAHGPNEFLHIPTAIKLTHCIRDIIAAHYQRCV